MPKIRLTPEVLKSKAGEIQQCQQEQVEIINSVQGVIDNVVGDWEGEAQKGFIQAFEAAKPAYQKFAPDLERFSDFLNNYADTMEYLDVAGGQEIRS